jgi:hypothetical protein
MYDNKKIFISFLYALGLMTVVLGCGGGGGSSPDSEDPIDSASHSSLSQVQTPASTPTFSRIRVSLGVAYVLEADVFIGNRLADIIVDDGQYEWLEYYSGISISKDGAIDIVEPIGSATSDDYSSIVMTAPKEYGNINPFTSLLQLGVSDLDTIYPNAASYETDSKLIFDFDTYKVSNSDSSIAIEVARETLKALFMLVDKQNTFTREADILTDELKKNIDECQTLPCVKNIAKNIFSNGITPKYSQECELLPGLNNCLDYEPISSSSSEMSSSSSEMSSSSSEMSSSSSEISSSSSEMSISSYSAVNNGSNPFPRSRF